MFERYSVSSCHQREKNTSSQRHNRATGPAPSWAPCSKADRNIAKFSDTRLTPMPSDCCSSSVTMNSIVPLGDFGDRRIKSSDTPLVPHGTNDSIATTVSLVLHGFDEQAVTVGGITQSTECHREAALAIGVAPGVRPLDDSGHLVGRDVAVASHPHGEPGAPCARHGLTDRAHIGTGEPEAVRIQDRFVAELQRVEARFAKCLRRSRTGTHHARGPAVLLAQPQPRLDRLRPRLRFADGVTAGKAHAHFDAVGDRRASVRREHRRLVASGGEVAE